MSGAVISVRGMAAGYGERVALSAVSLEVKAGELVALVGPNGSGKSTLLKCIVGLLRPSAGEARVAAPRVAYLPQAEDLRWDLPLTVDDVVLMGMTGRLSLGGRAGPSEDAVVRSALERVLATHLAGRTIDALSGGERQRVLIARALAADPQLYLLDEPTTGVDATTEEELMNVFQQLAAAGRTVVVATHDLSSVLAHFSRVVCLAGRVVADGPVALLRDAEVLRATYGGHPPETPMLAADSHHA